MSDKPLADTRVRFDGSALLARQVLEELELLPSAPQAYLARVLGAPFAQVGVALQRLLAAGLVRNIDSNWSIAP